MRTFIVEAARTLRQVALGVAFAALSPAMAAPSDVRMPPDSMAQRAKACTACHGPQGQSRPEGYVPRIAGKPGGYLFAQLVAFRDGRRSNATMRHLLENLSDDMLRELAGHFASLELPYPPPATRPAGEADARRAESLIRHGDVQLKLPPCAACHGDRLTGIAPRVPGLLGLPRDYLVAQLGAWRNGVRHTREPDCMASIARHLPDEEISRVAQWLASQPVPPDARPSLQAPPQWPMECGALTP